MSIEAGASELLNSFGVPATAATIATFLVRGAKYMEEDANETALLHISSFLLDDRLSVIGKAGASLIPRIFDKIYGNKFLSLKFTVRSALSTLFFWFLLLVIRKPDWQIVFGSQADSEARLFIISWIFIDYVSMVKSRFIMKLISEKYAIRSCALFFFLDTLLSYMIPLIFYVIVGTSLWHRSSYSESVKIFVDHSITDYFVHTSSEVVLPDVIVLATLTTSVWGGVAVYLLYSNLLHCTNPVHFAFYDLVVSRRREASFDCNSESYGCPHNTGCYRRGAPARFSLVKAPLIVAS